MEGDGAGDDYEEEDVEEGDKEEDGGEVDQEESISRPKKQAVGSWHRCGIGGCVYKSKKSGNLSSIKLPFTTST